MMHAVDTTGMSRRRFVGRAVLLGLIVLVVAACGGADPDSESSAGLTVPVLDVVVAADVATLMANVVATGDDLATVLIEWGDGTSDTVTSGFPGVRLDHTYTADGDFTIVLEARTAAGQSVIATTGASITAFATAAAASLDDPDGPSDGGGSSTGDSGGSGAGRGGSTEPSPTPSPSPEPEPQPILEPVTLDLRDSNVVIDLVGSRPDDVGGSAETERQGLYSFGVRSYAWHGSGGSGTARGTLVRTVDATSVLVDLPEQITAVTAEVSYELDVRAEVKGPYDRFSRVRVEATLAPPFGRTIGVASLTVNDDDTNPIRQVNALGSTGTLVTTLTRDQPATTFEVVGECYSRSGSQVIAFFNEGYCDALDKGGITLRSLSVTLTPIIED